MGKLRNVELAVELPINAREQVEIERCRDADGVVVGADEALARFDQIGPEQQEVAWAHTTTDAGQERRRFRAGEVADGAAEKQQQHGLAGPAWGHCLVNALEIRGRESLNLRVLHAAESSRAGVAGGRGNINR